MTSTRGWLDAYFERIGYDGPTTATLDTLQAVHLLHPQAIPFENLDPLLGRPMELGAAWLRRKLLDQRRGGWCFEHNLLLSEVLQALGFAVTGLAARVLWNAPEGEIRPRSHMLLKIDGLEGGPHLADVGFGRGTLTAPLRLNSGDEQATPHETFRLMDEVLQVRLDGAWKPVYRFDLQPQHRVDYEVANWYLAHHPDSAFTHTLMAARATPQGRYGLLNNSLSTHGRDGRAEHTKLTTGTALRQVLENIFGIRLPEDPGLEALLARLAQYS